MGVKSLLLPLSIKQVKSTSKMSELQPQMQEIQKKHKDDKEKQSAEIMKLYKENKVSPAGGCLPLLVQMPILFSLYYVISQPLKYMVGKSPEIIA
jgi:YidC/Oxa1 family membrane protein insertase